MKKCTETIGGVGVISANFEAPGFRDNEVSRLGSFRGQVWGTWRNHWNSYFKNTWDFDYSSGDKGGPSGWDWNLSLRILPKNGLVSIVPHSSRSMHTGLHGIHSNRKNFADSQTISFQSERPNIELIEVGMPEWNFRDKVIRRTAQKLSRPGGNYKINEVARRLLQKRYPARPDQNSVG